MDDGDRDDDDDDDDECVDLHSHFNCAHQNCALLTTQYSKEE